MTDSTNITLVPGSSGAAVRDVQARLQTLGLNQAADFAVDLGDETEAGVFGPRTAQTVAAFRSSRGLPAGDEVDRDTWMALVDATFTFGDRLLYLRLPHFHGCDVHTLQTALSSLGFSCTADSIFGGHTERAVREFQQNAGINSDGIVGDSTFSAILRLRHAWEGKNPLSPEAQSQGFARAAEVLERTPICIYGTDELGRAVAERISNLAMATTTASLVVSAPSLDQTPDDSMLMIQLVAEPPSALPGPQVIYEDDRTLKTRMATAISLLASEQPRITVLLAYKPAKGERFSPREEQHAAIALLDALCSAYA